MASSLWRDLSFKRSVTILGLYVERHASAEAPPLPENRIAGPIEVMGLIAVAGPAGAIVKSYFLFFWYSMALLMLVNASSMFFIAASGNPPDWPA